MQYETVVHGGLDNLAGDIEQITPKRKLRSKREGQADGHLQLKVQPENLWSDHYIIMYRYG